MDGIERRTPSSIRTARAEDQPPKKTLSPENRAAISKGLTGRKLSPETKEKMSRARRRWWENHPEARQELSQVQAARWQGREYWEKMRAAIKAGKRKKEDEPRPFYDNDRQAA